MASTGVPFSENLMPRASSSGKKEISAPNICPTGRGLAASPFNSYVLSMLMLATSRGVTVMMSVEPFHKPAEVASILMMSGLMLPCTMNWALPLNRRRCQAPSTHWSGSWLLGSPLPTPMILPSPAMENRMRLSASGTSRPSRSTTVTLMTLTSWPSANMVVL